MECPICKNTMGFVCGMCIECGYNHLTHKYDWIKVSTEMLKQIVSPEMFYYLVAEHEKWKQR